MLPFWFFHTVIVLTSDLASLAALVAKTINIEGQKRRTWARVLVVESMECGISCGLRIVVGEGSSLHGIHGGPASLRVVSPPMVRGATHHLWGDSSGR